MNPSNILFIAEGQTGDLLLLTPAIRAVKKQYPSSSIKLLVLQRRENKLDNEVINFNRIFIDSESNVLKKNKNIDEIFIINHSALKSIKGFKHFKIEADIISFLRKQNFDTAICTFPNDRFLIWSYFIGAKIRVGQNKKWMSFLLNRVCDSKKEDTGVLNYYLELVKKIDAQETSFETDFEIATEAVVWADEIFAANGIIDREKIIVIHPGASGSYKIWPPEKFALLINELSKNHQVILCSGGSDDHIFNDIKKLSNDFIRIDDGNNIHRLAAVFKKSCLVITNDSGPRHLAAAVKARSLALFRKYNDNAWKIYPENNMTATIQSLSNCIFCEPGKCNDLIPQGEKFGSYCMREIKVEEVVKRAEELISNETY
jgi:heptosyltransferase II